MAYNAAIVFGKDQQAPDGSVRIVIRFTGNAGEVAVDIPFTVTDETTVQILRRFVFDTAVKLNSKKTIADQITVGLNLTPLAPPTPPAATAEEIWLTKINKLRRLTSLGTLSGQLGIDITALRDDIVNTYANGFLNNA